MILLPCLRRQVVPPVRSLPVEIQPLYENELAYAERIRGASIYPAIQNILLACRALGLGTKITTNHISREGEVRALLKIPPEFDTFAMMPIGWPVDDYGPLTRRPLTEVAYSDGWGNSWPPCRAPSEIGVEARAE